MTIGFNPVTFGNVLTKRNFTKPNKFLARIPLPQGLQDGTYDSNMRDVQFFCESTNLPGAYLHTYKASRYSYGTWENRPTGYDHQDTEFVFFADGGVLAAGTANPTVGTYYDFFTKWARLIFNFDSHRGITAGGGVAKNTGVYDIGYKIDYVSNIELYVFTDDGQVSHCVTLRDAFPITVNDIKLNWADNSGVMKISVIITYTDWFLTEVVDSDVPTPGQTPYNNIPTQPTPQAQPEYGAVLTTKG